ncbi:MAG: hypothetical protein SGBAC_009175 [Bacillariaceae sp.]
MKFSTIILFLASIAAVGAFAPTASHPQRVTSLAVSKSDPEVADAIAELRAAAKDFGSETEHFANVWVDRVLSGEQDGVASGLLEECVIDDSEKCQRFEQALKRLDGLLGVGAGEQY